MYLFQLADKTTSFVLFLLLLIFSIFILIILVYVFISVSWQDNLIFIADLCVNFHQVNILTLVNWIK